MSVIVDSRVIVETDVMVPMRDGVKLATNIWRPDTTEAVPVILVRTPYSKDAQFFWGYSLFPDIFALIKAGYAFVMQDCRGSFNSEDEFVHMGNEALDGEDTIKWLAEQFWCDGKIGATGISYLGFTQWESASTSIENLKAIIPVLTSTDYYKAPWYSNGGALSLSTSYSWTATMAIFHAQRELGLIKDPALLLQASKEMATIAGVAMNVENHIQKAPYKEFPFSNKHAKLWEEWVAHPSHDEYWDDLAVSKKPENIKVPALNIGGWYDIFIKNTVETYNIMKEQAGSEEARNGQYLLIGPWDHTSSKGMYPNRQYGPLANAQAINSSSLFIKFFDRYVRGIENALDGVAPVRLFVMGIDQWRDEQAWPLPDTQYTEYFLSSEGTANTAKGTGVLSVNAATKEQKDSYAYDPRNPVQTIGGQVMLPVEANQTGPVDQSPLENREDILFYETPVLEEAVEVTGHISLNVFVSSDAVDTDFTGKLVDVFPDGRAIILTEGLLRARYRNSLSEPELLNPNEVYELTLDLGVTSNVFLPGHQIRLEVSSSNFPRYDRNTNTGGDIAYESEEDMIVANNTIYHGPNYPSRLILPIIDRKSNE